MNLFLDKNLAVGYKNKSQIARILTEGWVEKEIFCPNCGDKIESYANNRPVADFYCNKCSEDFELKSKKGKIGKKIAAGAYSKMIERLNSEQKPHFFFILGSGLELRLLISSRQYQYCAGIRKKDVNLRHYLLKFTLY